MTSGRTIWRALYFIANNKTGQPSFGNFPRFGKLAGRIERTNLDYSRAFRAPTVRVFDCELCVPCAQLWISGLRSSRLTETLVVERHDRTPQSLALSGDSPTIGVRDVRDEATDVESLKDAAQ